MYFSKSFLDYSSIIVLFISLSTGIISADLDDVDDKREGRSLRLPNTTYPLKYHLHITTWIHREILNFTGNATIELLVKESTSELVLHSEDLKIHKVFLQDLTTKQEILNLKSRIIDDDLLVISVENNSALRNTGVFIKDHRLRLEIHYSGVIKNNSYGITITTYKDKKNKEVYGAYTQLEPSYARRVLPCYDEPGLKAKFAVRITHGSNYTAISNMPDIATIKHGADYSMMTTTFQDTPKMCTYLLAFLVSNFEVISEESEGILHRVFKPPNSMDRGELALANSIKITKTFGRYMDIPYSLPKIDHADVDLINYAGMENWGLITYANNAFPYGRKVTYLEQLLTEHHEMVHQWFGNLVSPIWWDSIWLNEGFATYYSYKLSDMLYPELNAMKELFHPKNCYKLVEEATIRYVEKREDILDLFGASSYAKPACILNMFSNIIGEETFHSGVKNHLKAHAYSSANGDQLFQHLQNAIDRSKGTIWKLNVSEVMKPWFTKKKMPELLVTRNYKYPYIINIKQKAQEPSQEGITRFWWLPLHFGKTTDNDTESITYLMPPIEEATLDLRTLNVKLLKNDLLNVNIPGITYYTVSYDAENTLRIARALQKDPHSINAMNRVVIVRSIIKMWTEQSAIVPKLELLKYLRKENDNYVWTAISDSLLNFSNMLYANDTKFNNALKAFMRNIVAKHYLKYERKSPKTLTSKEEQMLKAHRSLACNYELDDCLTKRKQQILKKQKRTYDSNNKLHDPREVCYIAKTFTNQEFLDTLRYLRNAADDTETMYWSWLRCTDSEEQYRQFLRVLSDITVEKNVRKQHLQLWADLLTSPAADVMKWNLTHKFLLEQMSKLQQFPKATNILRTHMENKAEDIRPQFKEQYINLMNEFPNKKSVEGAKYQSSEVQENLKQIGANYMFEKHPLWQQEKEKAYKWLEAENYASK